MAWPLGRVAPSAGPGNTDRGGGRDLRDGSICQNFEKGRGGGDGQWRFRGGGAKGASPNFL